MKSDLKSLRWEFVWGAIDELALRCAGQKAQSNGRGVLEAKSGLSKGMLRESRRIRKGVKIWPSMSTVTKILGTMDMSLAEFSRLKCKPYQPKPKHQVRTKDGPADPDPSPTPTEQPEQVGWHDRRLHLRGKMAS